MKFLMKTVMLLLAVLSDTRASTSEENDIIPHEDVLDSLRLGTNVPDVWKNDGIDLLPHPNPSLIKANFNVYSSEDKSPIVVSELDPDLRDTLSSLAPADSEAPPIDEAIYPPLTQ